MVGRDSSRLDSRDERRRPGQEIYPALGHSPPRSVTALRAGGWLAAVVLVAALAYAGYWFFAASQLRDATLAWVAARQTWGDEIRLGQPALSGFPGTIRLEIEKPLVRTTAPGGPVSWQADRLAITMHPFTPGRLVLRTSGPQEVTVEASGASRRYAGSVERLDARLRVEGPAVPEMSADLVALRLSAGPGEDFAVSRANGRYVTTDPPAANGTAATAKLEAMGVSMPAALQLPLGHEIARLSLDAEWRGPLPSRPLEDSLQVWRDAGGTVEVRHVYSEYGPLSVDGDGTLSLDRAMQPIAAMSGQVGGLFETIDRLRDAGQVRSRDATTAKLVLATLARRDAATGRSVIDVPLTLQDRILSVGPVRVLEVPPLTWPGSPGAMGSAPR